MSCFSQQQLIVMMTPFSNEAANVLHCGKEAPIRCMPIQQLTISCILQKNITMFASHETSALNELKFTKADYIEVVFTKACNYFSPKELFFTKRERNELNFQKSSSLTDTCRKLMSESCVCDTISFLSERQLTWIFFYQGHLTQS